MATSTFGSTAQTSLTALVNAGYMNPTDLAAIINAIKDDLNVAHPVIPGSYSQNDLLYVPNRGILKVMPGDWVAVDSQGWPILVSANSIANSTWVHSP
jgi:hypothetical protein